jgi:hypothetical protein
MMKIKDFFMKNKLLVIFLIMFIISPFIIELSPPINESIYGDKYSTVSPYSNGCEGIYRVSDKLGFNISRYNYSTTFLRSIDKRLLVVIDGESNFKTEEKDFYDADSINQIVSWVKEGNKFLLISVNNNNFIRKIEFGSEKIRIQINKDFNVLKLGKGEIIFYDKPNDFTNKKLKKNAKRFFNIIEYTRCKDIAFDEYIHGYSKDENAWDVLPNWAKMCVIEIIIIGLMITIMNLKRFGKPKIIENEELRTINEYYKAAANLYEKTSDYYDMMKEYFEYFSVGFLKKYGKYDLNFIDKNYSVIIEIWKDRELASLDILKDCVVTLETSNESKDIPKKTFYEFIYKVGVLRKEIGI